MLIYYLSTCCSIMFLSYFTFCLCNAFLLFCLILFLSHPFLYSCCYSDYTGLKLKCIWKKFSFTLLSYNLIENVLLVYTYEDNMFLMAQVGQFSVLKLHRFEYNFMYLLKTTFLMKDG